MQKTKEIRCNCCKKLLARAKTAQSMQGLEIKCMRCKTINKF